MARLVILGRAGSSGVGIGRLLRLSATDDSSSATSPAPVAASERPHEQDRLRQALEQASRQLARLADETRARAGADTAAIFEAQALFVKDPLLVDQALAAIAEKGLGAAEAIEVAAATHAEILAALEDEYFRARAADIRDVGKRVAAILQGRAQPSLPTSAGEPAVIAADDLDASLVAELRPELVAGVALAGGAPTGHATIVARALGIPLALGLGEALLGVPEGEEVIVDGTLGRVLIAPDAGERLAIEPNGTPHMTPGVELPMLALPVVIEGNAGSVREVEQCAAAGAHSIGLVRTELLFLGRSVAPGLDEQRALYRRIQSAMPHGPVVFRTLDVGGDKPAGYRPAMAEANPALGVRGVRLGLRHPELLEVQLRALLEATPELPLHVMFPMVATLNEVRAARAALERAAEASRSAGLRVAEEVHVGIMVEVPAAALMADVLALEVDFFSIGTNDLIQYTMAADRTSAELADLGTPFEPAVLRLVGQVCRAASEHARPVAVCGEAAADPLVAPLLVGLGVSHLSVAASSVRQVYQSLAPLSVERCRAAADAALRAHTGAEVQQIVERLVRS
jgi:phosphoenolpyruvate-protein phosphotransferase (PTS system enzyme I)